MEQSIRLNLEQNEIWRVEKFVESIADRYNIFNSYYGNILVSLVESTSAVREKNKWVATLQFLPDNRGLKFSIYGDFGDISENKNLLFLLNKLADECEYDNQSIHLTFSINSINRQLSSERRKVFSHYIQGAGPVKREKNQHG